MTIYLVRQLPVGSSDVLRIRMASNLAAHSYLASGGVYMAPVVTNRSVSSYLAFSTLPIRAVIFCCTFLEVTFTGRYPAPCSVKLGLSSLNGCTVPRSHTTDLPCHYSIKEIKNQFVLLLYFHYSVGKYVRIKLVARTCFRQIIDKTFVQ